MKIILNAGLGIGILMFLLLLFKRYKKQGDYFFIGWILVTLAQVAFYEITIYRFPLKGFTAIVGFGLPLLGAPLLFLYILSLTRRSVSRKTIGSHLSVYILYVLIFLVLKGMHTTSLIALNGYIQPSENGPLWMQYYAVPLAISGLVYCIWDLLLLRRHRKTITALFSFDERINLRWVVYIIYSYFVLFIVASFLIFGAIQFQLFPIKNAFALVGITLSFMLIAFGFYGFRQTAIFSSIEPRDIVNLGWGADSLPTTSYSKSGLTKEKIRVLANQLTTLMKTEKPFLNEELNLPLLSQQSQISPSHLSQVINQHFQMNFYDFVNQYRVEEAKKKLISKDFDHLSILGIAFECGFKSKSSFNRYFRKYTGSSPSEFKKRQLQ